MAVMVKQRAALSLEQDQTVEVLSSCNICFFLDSILYVYCRINITLPSSINTSSTSNTTLTLKLQQIRILLKLRIPLPLQTPPRNLDIKLNILNQTLLANIIILGPDESQNDQIHMTAVEILFEFVQYVDFDGADGVFVKGVPADGHYLGVHFVGGGEGGVAVVDARFDVLVAAYCEA